MPYLDNLLAAGEQPIRRDHQHWFVLLADARYGILAILAGLVLAILGSGLTGPIRDVVGYASLALIVGGVAYFLWQILRYMNEEYIVTTRRVLQLEGVLNKKSTDSSLEKINDAVLTQGLLGRMFGFGDLDILTASETGISRLRMLRQPDDFKRAMLEAKHDLELELSGARPLPSPPLRTTVSTEPPPAPTATAAAAPSAAAPAASAMSADEVTRTLANLADLRDRGAISAEDYEAKKADLLRRL